MNDFMMNRGRAAQIYQWSQVALGIAEQLGDFGRKANTLRSLGDLESRLRNVAAARGHYEAALALYELEEEPGGIINTLVSQAELEAATTSITSSLRLYEAAFAVANGTGFANHPAVKGMRQRYEVQRELEQSALREESESLGQDE